MKWLNFKVKTPMMEKVSRRLNIVWVSSHFHLDGTGCRRSTSFPPRSFSLSVEVFVTAASMWQSKLFPPR